jgi:hypothetical protein
VAFEIAPYDIGRPLVLDPVLVYSTYLGGSGDDYGSAIAVDALGNAYLTGETSSIDFPTANALQRENAGPPDAFVAKLDAAGSALVYSTYIGGSDFDTGTDIAVDAWGRAYVVGYTYSVDFPTANALQAQLASPPGATPDAFVAKLNAAGSAFVYSTYLGGTSYDYGFAIAADTSGNAYTAGFTLSTDFPTANAIQAENAGSGDAFIAKLDSAGSAFAYSTYLGGSEGDTGNGIAADGSGNAYVAGYTSSTDFPTANAFQSEKGGTYDAFVTKLDAAGSALVYSTYLGGSDDEIGYGIAVDAFSHAYITGYTRSTNFPTRYPFQGVNRGGTDAYVTRLNAEGSGLVYSTYLGGSAEDFGLGIAVDRFRHAYVTGRTGSTNFPTRLPFQAMKGGEDDAFVTKLNTTGGGQTSVGSLLYSTYLGGNSNEFGRGIAVDGSSNAYISGFTFSTDFPTANALQAENAGSSDAFVSKISTTPQRIEEQGEVNSSPPDRR